MPATTGAPGLPKEIEDGLKRPDAIWAGTSDRTAPVWFAFKDGKIYLLSQKEHGPEEQSVPGLAPGTEELVVITRRKGRETALGRFTARVRVFEEGPEWEAAAALLVDRRRSRVGPPSDSVERWRGTCYIAELTPVVATH